MSPSRFIAVCSVATLAILAASSSSARAAESGEESSDPKPKSKVLWLDAEGGLSHANLSTFTQNYQAFSVGFIPREGTGPSVGGAVGLRLVFLTIGVRGRVASYTNSEPNQAVRGWTMSSIDPEIGLRIPLGRFEPYATLAAGYTTFGGFGNAVRGVQNGMNVNGFNARMGVGFDYFVSKYISLGILGTGEVLGLTRDGVPVREIAKLPQSETVDAAAVRFLEANGSTWGMALALNAGVKAHF